MSDNDVYLEHLEERLANALNTLSKSTDSDGTIIALSMDLDSYKHIAESQAKEIERLKTMLFHFTGEME